MAGVDLEIKKLHEQWEEDDKQFTPAHSGDRSICGEGLVYRNHKSNC